MTLPVTPPPGFDIDIAVRAVDAARWRTTDPLTWTGRPRGDRAADTIVVPVGFVTDFATIPRFLQWLFRPYGPYTRAAVLHDYLLMLLAEWSAADPETRGPSPFTSREIDGIFRAAMRDLGTPAVVRWPMWAAVRVASLFSRKRAHGREFLRDAPAVLGVAVLAIGNVVIPVAALAVLVALGFVKALVFLFGGRPPMRLRRRGRPVGGSDVRGK